MRNRAFVPLTLAVVLLVAACNNDGAALSTTSSLITGTTEAPAAAETTTSTTQAGDSANTTVAQGQTVSTYEVVARISSDNGETLYIVIPPGAYTDIDLEGFVGDLKESDPDLFGAEVFDDPDAVQAFVIPEEQRTEPQQQLLDEHHLVSLVGGDTIRFQGPFEDIGEHIIGS
jgi:hypothetical protein